MADESERKAAETGERKRHNLEDRQSDKSWRLSLSHGTERQEATARAFKQTSTAGAGTSVPRSVHGDNSPLSII